MTRYQWRREAGERAAEVAAELEAIRKVAAERTGWEEWMTAEVSYAATFGRWCYWHMQWETAECTKNGNGMATAANCVCISGATDQ